MSQTTVTRPSRAVNQSTDAVTAFEQCRGRLFGIAYRMTGNVMDAEDIVQEAWIRWQRTRHDEIREPAAFLATVATRLSINALQSAHSRHEVSIDQGMLEMASGDDDPSLTWERTEALQRVIRTLLGTLTPPELASFILREAFAYPYEQIAEIVGTTPVNTRQLVSRARRHLASRPRATASTHAQHQLAQAFRRAAQHGDLAELEALLALAWTPAPISPPEPSRAPHPMRRIPRHHHRGPSVAPGLARTFGQTGEQR